MQEALVTPPPGDDIVRRAREIRAAFDDGFRVRTEIEVEPTVDVLAVSIADEHVGVLVEQAAQIVSKPTLVRVPDADAGCLGVIGHRGKLVAVFELAPELAPVGVAGVSVVIVSRVDPTIGFAASSVVGYRRAKRSAIVAPADRRDETRVGTLVGEAPLLVLSLDTLASRLASDASDASDNGDGL